MQDVTLEGRPFDVQAATRLAAGASAAEVLALLGEPLSVTPHADGAEDWRWFVRGRMPRWIHVFSLQFRLGSMTVRSEVILRMRNGRLERFGKFEPRSSPRWKRRRPATADRSSSSTATSTSTPSSSRSRV